jgi:hypothetical protein
LLVKFEWPFIEIVMGAVVQKVQTGTAGSQRQDEQMVKALENYVAGVLDSDREKISAQFASSIQVHTPAGNTPYTGADRVSANVSKVMQPNNSQGKQKQGIAHRTLPSVPMMPSN